MDTERPDHPKMCSDDGYRNLSFSKSNYTHGISSFLFRLELNDNGCNLSFLRKDLLEHPCKYLYEHFQRTRSYMNIMSGTTKIKYIYL